MAARPRGGEWLFDEMAYWRQSGVETVVSLLEPQKERDLGLLNERAETHAAGMVFRSLPLQDRGVPASEMALRAELDFLDSELRAGRAAALHCRHGVGRTGIVAACLLLASGWDPERALKALGQARGLTVPETEEQKDWLYRFASSLAIAR